MKHSSSSYLVWQVSLTLTLAFLGIGDTEAVRGYHPSHINNHDEEEPHRVLQYYNNTPTLSVPPPLGKNLWVAHGAVMMFAFGIFMPLAIAGSTLRRILPGESLWFKIHKTLNTIAFLLVLAGIGIAKYQVRRRMSHGRVPSFIVYVNSFSSSFLNRCNCHGSEFNLFIQTIVPSVRLFHSLSS